MLSPQHSPRQVLRLRILLRQTKLVCAHGNIIRLLRALETQKRLGKVIGALECRRILQAVDIDSGTGIMLNVGPFLELDPGNGAVGKEGRVVRVFENTRSQNELVMSTAMCVTFLRGIKRGV